MHSRCPYQTFPQMLRAVCQQFGEASALEEGPLCLTYQGLLARVEVARAALQARGIQPGDRIALWAPNQWEWVVVALASLTVGAVLVPLNTRYKAPEARYILEKAQVKLLFTTHGFLGLDYVAMLELPDLPTVVFRSPSWEAFLKDGADHERAMADSASPGSSVLGTSLGSAVPGQQRPPALPDDAADILFTSGTTGRPKGVISTHAQTLQAYWSWSEVVGLQQGDRYLVVAPFFHSFGYKAGWLACLLRGATILPQATFDVDEVLARIPRDRVSVLPGPPALYQSLLMRDLSRAELGTLRLAVTGAAAIPVQLIQRMYSVLGFKTVVTGYGLTESTGMATMCRWEDDPETIAQTSGRAIPGVEVKVVVNGRDAAVLEAGEILIRGYNVMAGYLDDPDATREVIRDGWLHTGDIGTLDAAGNLRITDRLKDMVIVGGFNVYPAEVENVLAEHPDIGQAAVIGIPDARLGEVCMAVVVLVRPLEEAALIAWCRERMANFKVPRRVAFVSELPRNASGKVLKFLLRERFTADWSGPA